MNNKAYKVFARKYRPKNFSEIVGQDVLVKTLSYSISNDRLAQSYLLTGTRGIGKTTTARVIAKTVNCTNLVIENNLPKPCETCNNCTSFVESSHPDIIEIDAASRTSVDDVRVIIENSEYKPLLGKYKIFIIDEVHMLSKNAFNALLKLLEEPPLHVIFIFATTEIQKIPVTIISRCQRFDLLRFTSDDLLILLKNICDNENIPYDDNALKILTKKADGSARDAISILNQVALSSASEEKSISIESVESLLGLGDKFLPADFLLLITENDPERSIELLNKYYRSSSNFSIFLEQLLDLIAYISKKFAIPNYSSVEFSSTEDVIDKIVKNSSMTWLQIAWQLCFNSSNMIKNSVNQLQFMEMLALKLIYACQFDQNHILKQDTQENKNLNSQTSPEDQKKNFKTNLASSSNPRENFSDKIISISENTNSSDNISALISNSGNNSLLNSADLIPNRNSSNKEIISYRKNNKNFQPIQPKVEVEFLTLILDFLKFLKNSSEYEIFYYLFNHCEIENFSENKLELTSNIQNSTLKNDLSYLLNKWNKSKISLNIKYNQDKTINSLKEVMIENFKNTEVWNMILNEFSNPEIEDILLA